MPKYEIEYTMPNIWTVGYNKRGDWVALSDHNTREKAEKEKERLVAEERKQMIHYGAAGVFGGPRQETREPDADCFRKGDVW